MGKERGNEINPVPGLRRESSKRPDIGQDGSDPSGDKITGLENVDLTARLSEKLGINVKVLNLNDIDLNILQRLANSSSDNLTPSYELIDYVPESEYRDPKKRMVKANTSLRKLEFKLYFYGIKIKSKKITGQKKYGYYLQYPESPADTVSSPSDIQEHSNLTAVPSSPSSTQMRTKADLSAEAMREAVNRYKEIARSSIEAKTELKSPGQTERSITSELPQRKRATKAQKIRRKITPREFGRMHVKTSPPPTVYEAPRSGDAEDKSGQVIVITAQEALCLRLVKLYGAKVPELEMIAGKMGLTIADLKRVYISAIVKEAVLESEEKDRSNREYVEENYNKK